MNFRGSWPAKIDDKGRLKLPSQFLRDWDERFQRDCFVTSLFGDCALIYPIEIWEEIEERLGRLPSTDRKKQKYLERVNYFGQQLRFDAQGRVVIPQILRERAEMEGDVIVGGQLNHLKVENRQRLEARFETDAITDDDLAYLSERGV